MELETARLRLRPLQAGDAAAVIAYRQHPAVARFQSWCPPTSAEVAEFVSAMPTLEAWRAGHWTQLAILDRCSGTVLGDVGLQPGDDGAPTLELGITIAPANHRRGYAREALAGLVPWLWSHTPAVRLIGNIDPDNVASLALFAGLGFRLETAAPERSGGFEGTARDGLRLMLRRT